MICYLPIYFLRNIRILLTKNDHLQQRQHVWGYTAMVGVLCTKITMYDRAGLTYLRITYIRHLLYSQIKRTNVLFDYTKDGTLRSYNFDTNCLQCHLHEPVQCWWHCRKVVLQTAPSVYSITRLDESAIYAIKNQIIIF